MRRFADTLPTLRDSQSRTAPPQAGFEAEAILKVLGAAPRARTVRREPHVDEHGDAHIDNFGDGQAEAPQEHGAGTAHFRPAPEPRSTRAGNGPAFHHSVKPAARGGGDPFPRTVQNTIPAIDAAVAEGAASAIENARAETRAKVEQEVAAAVAEAISEAEAAASARLDAERIHWGQELASSLSTQLDQAFAALHDRIADATAAALAPVLEEEMTRKAVERFSARLDSLLSRESPARAVVVKGPQPLIDALGELRSGKTPSVQLVASEDAELTARINDTSLRTTIGMWAGTLTNSSGPRNVTK